MNKYTKSDPVEAYQQANNNVLKTNCCAQQREKCLVFYILGEM